MLNKHFPVFFFFISFQAFAAEQPLLKDPRFENGYTVMSPQKDVFTDRADEQAVHQRVLSDSEPVWRLVQWGSDYSLANSESVTLQDAAKKWQVSEGETVYKSVQLGSDGAIELMLNGLAEFSSEFYQDKKQLYLKGLDYHWPHLLLAQNIDSKKLAEYKRVEFSLDAKLLFDVQNKREGYQQALHAARFPVAIAVRNTLSNNTFWLILVVYDDRFPESSFNCEKCITDKMGVEACSIPASLEQPGRWECPFDGTRWSEASEKKGTQKMLFRVPTTAFARGNIRNGDWTHYQINLLPFIEAGIQAARDTRRLNGFSKDLRFYDLTFLSMGWEITGLNQAAMAVKNISLTGF